MEFFILILCLHVMKLNRNLIFTFSLSSRPYTMFMYRESTINDYQSIVFGIVIIKKIDFEFSAEISVLSSPESNKVV